MIYSPGTRLVLSWFAFASTGLNRFFLLTRRIYIPFVKFTDWRLPSDVVGLSWRTVRVLAGRITVGYYRRRVQDGCSGGRRGHHGRGGSGRYRRSGHGCHHRRRRRRGRRGRPVFQAGQHGVIGIGGRGTARQGRALPDARRRNAALRTVTGIAVTARRLFVVIMVLAGANDVGATASGQGVGGRLRVVLKQAHVRRTLGR